ncbi:hypothetical protein PBRA_007790 [Plasmodiophora brassicae]|uniref:Uncharacterized protein n=1 Tax=Plasmodiophora brassicae TaxID=37360 RepID=A0A0G4IYB4_PLABS|nr:hypothetical protein PBRA_007790 [Plasmodiophora brassicae]
MAGPGSSLSSSSSSSSSSATPMLPPVPALAGGSRRRRRRPAFIGGPPEPSPGADGADAAAVVPSAAAAVQLALSPSLPATLVLHVCCRTGPSVDIVRKPVFRQSTEFAPAPSSSSGATEPVQALLPAVTAFMESLLTEFAALYQKMDSVASTLQVVAGTGSLSGD